MNAKQRAVYEAAMAWHEYDLLPANWQMGELKNYTGEMWKPDRSNKLEIDFRNACAAARAAERKGK